MFYMMKDWLEQQLRFLTEKQLLKQRGKEVYEYTLLDRLAIVGSSGMGALTYEPQLEMTIDSKTDDLDELESQCRKILNTEYSEKDRKSTRLNSSH